MAEDNQSVITISLPEADHVLAYVRSHFGGEVPSVGAHITLLYPWMSPVLIDERVLAELESLFAGFPIFDFSLRLGWFGREVLLLVPENPDPFIRLTKAIISRWPEFPYYGGEYEKIEPHATLAYGNEASLSGLAAEIANQVPVQACASSATLSTGQPGHMTVLARFPFSSVDWAVAWSSELSQT